MSDSATSRIPAEALLPGAPARDANPQIARLATQFISSNRATLQAIGAEMTQEYDGNRVDLVMRSGNQIGAVPLASPTTTRMDFGLVIKPRFEWAGLGLMLSEMGWRITPSPLAMPLLPRSERQIPAWVLSSMVLARVQALLDQLSRRFEVIDEVRSAPRGAVDWTSYATRYAVRGQFLQVPCRFPDLRDDRELRGAIRFVLGKQMRALEGQRPHGAFVIRLIDLCGELLERVRDAAPCIPSPREFESWMRGSLKSETYRAGIQAMSWTVEDRGLAGLSDLQGLPWVMPMEQFFEAWSETVLAIVARRIGGSVLAGRLRQTVRPLVWEPPYLGSQKSLIPDLVLERGDATLIIDAKYKEHWEEMQERPWAQLEAELRERHRADLLQVLAYANLAVTPRIIVCLAYPCSKRTWQSPRDRHRLFHRATLQAGDRQVTLLLTAFPMGQDAASIGETLAAEVVRD